MHFLRNVLARVPKGNSEMVAAAIRTVFAQPDAEHVHTQLDVIAVMLGRQFPAVETMLLEAREEVLAFTDFPFGHWQKIWSTNPLERPNKEIERRTDVVGVFPNPAASWSKPTTNGKRPTAATCPKAPWPSCSPSPKQPRRWRNRP